MNIVSFILICVAILHTVSPMIGQRRSRSQRRKVRKLEEPESSLNIPTYSSRKVEDTYRHVAAMSPNIVNEASEQTNKHVSANQDLALSASQLTESDSTGTEPEGRMDEERYGNYIFPGMNRRCRYRPYHCVLDPCNYASCPTSPAAVCVPNYCLGACGAAEFYIGMNIVMCNRAIYPHQPPAGRCPPISSYDPYDEGMGAQQLVYDGNGAHTHGGGYPSSGSLSGSHSHQQPGNHYGSQGGYEAYNAPVNIETGTYQGYRAARGALNIDRKEETIVEESADAAAEEVKEKRFGGFVNQGQHSHGSGSHYPGKQSCSTQDGCQYPYVCCPSRWGSYKCVRPI